ncbi:MAG: hypothetical protein C0594_16395 [Marinilabiliales bacterium]|nr:MAG: hypothetical protein C0594_16395 [Marinilabiliales bacterium]
METLVKKTNGKASHNDIADIKSKNGTTLVKVVKPTNGEEKPEVKTVENPVKVVEIVEPVKPVEPPKPQLSLEQKIEKIENLKTLIEKRERLEASRKKLTSFVVGANQFSENIILTDENGNTFKTSNTEVFTKVVDTINSTLVSKISEIEKQIEF